jgi:hypothetical protein
MLGLDLTLKPAGGGAARGFSIEASNNVLDGGNVILSSYYLKPGDPPPTEADFLSRSLSWKGDRNQFSPGPGFTAWAYSGTSDYGIKDLTEWNKFWKLENSGCRSGKVRYRGGDLASRADLNPEQLTPEDFRLHPDSPGYRADPGGKDLGADIDLVGPGAYERWKKTPEYQQWLKESGQLRAEAPKAERGAFVLLGGKGVEVGKFDTLAEAVQHANDGDTVEVRGNGPFVTQPVDLGTQALTIRAAVGYQPVIKGAVTRGVNESSLLRTQGPLVLEGLELHMTGGPDTSATVQSVRAPLHVANCRFVNTGGLSLNVSPGWLKDDHTLALTVRNCEFAGTHSGPPFVGSKLSNKGTVTLENNLFRGLFTHAFGVECDRSNVRDVAIRMNHNTMVGEISFVYGFHTVPESAGPGAAPDRQPVRMHLSANLFDPCEPGNSAFSLLLLPDWYHKDAKSLSAEEVERLLPRLIAQREERNLYGKGINILKIAREKEPGKRESGFSFEVSPPGRTLDDWLRFWKAGDSGSAEGVIKYEGGNLLAKMQSAPERIMPADFRLRPDSAGYRAGKDKKDLGADIDLVGPGAAYERWKKTPEYQQWLKDTGQLKK